MSQDNYGSQELKNWLEENKFGQFYEKLLQAGVESLNDLKILGTEEEIKELAGPNGINMGIVFRKKFISSVLELHNNNNVLSNDYDKKDKETASVSSQSNNDEMLEDIQSIDSSSSQNGPRKNSLKMSKSEEQSLTKLVQQIRLHTQQLKACKQNLTALHTQFDDSKKIIHDSFEKAISTLLVRKKQLQGALENAEIETIGKLDERIQDLQKSAKALLGCRQQVETKLRNANQGLEREQYVVNEIEKSLNDIPKDDCLTLNLVFDQGDVPLNTFIENYGSIAVGKRKVKVDN